MPYVTTINACGALGTSDAIDLLREFTALRTELDDIRAKYAAVVALLVAATAVGAGYSAGTTLAAKAFTPT